MTEKAVKEFCRNKIADYKIPDQVVFRQRLPLTGLGKIKKGELIEEAKQEAGQGA